MNDKQTSDMVDISESVCVCVMNLNIICMCDNGRRKRPLRQTDWWLSTGWNTFRRNEYESDLQTALRRPRGDYNVY